MCGEQKDGYSKALQDNGSPPRVRGTAEEPPKGATCTRITPACAGNSNLARFNLYRFKDHPRVCGEQLFVKLIHNLV